jgi:hypothetical protein
MNLALFCIFDSEMALNYDNFFHICQVCHIMHIFLQIVFKLPRQPAVAESAGGAASAAAGRAAAPPPRPSANRVTIIRDYFIEIIAHNRV